jgi:hypothetical protein
MSPSTKLWGLCANIFILAFLTFAQTPDYVITTREVWSTNQSWNTNIIVENGGILVIQAGVEVGIHYADVNGDNIGDVKLEVKNGGRLVINGTPDNPVVFKPTGANPPPANIKRHWQGIVLSSHSNPTDTLKFFKVVKAYNGLSIARKALVQGAIFDSVYNAGIIVQNSFSGDVNLNSCRVSNSSNLGLQINKAGVNVNYFTANYCSGNGIEINAANANLNWITVSYCGTGIYNGANATSTSLQNASSTYNTKSGLFNLDGSIQINNSDFRYNAYNGIVNSSGSLTITNGIVSNNTQRGFLSAGTGTTTVNSVTDTANSSFGFEITPVKMTADASTITGSNEGNPTVYFNYNNIFKNNGGLNNVQVRSTAGATPQADFTSNWWGVTTGIGSLVSVTTNNSVNYINWKYSKFTNATSNLSPTESITITYPTAGQTILLNEPITFTWSSIGNIGNVIIQIGTSYDTVSNNSSYTFTPTSAGALTLGVSKYKNGSPSASVNVTVANAVIALNSPTGSGITLYGNQSYTIKWVAASSISNVRIELSTDGGVNYLTPPIVAATPASSGSYVWTVPNISTTQARIRVSNVANPAQNSSSSNNITIIPKPNDALGGTWYYTNTGNNMTVHFQNVQYNDDLGNPLQTGTENIYVGAFYTSGGQVYCAGYTYVFFDGANPPNPATLTIWGDDPNTPQVDGVPIGSTVIFKIWRLSWNALDPDNDNPAGDPLDRAATPASAVVYIPNGLETRATLIYQRGTTTPVGNVLQSISLTTGWQMISGYVIPGITTLDHTAADNTGNVLSPASNPNVQGLAPNASGLVILKDGDGRVYWVTPQVYQLTNWNYLKGYFINMNSAATLKLVGQKIEPANEPIPLVAGWNLVPYFRDNPIDIVIAMNSIAEYLVIVKDDQGNVVWPAYGINTIGNAQPGEAYYVKVTRADNLIYPPNNYPKTKGDYNTTVLEVKKYKLSRTSPNSAIVGVLASALKDIAEIGDEIGAFDSKGNLVGSAAYNGENLAFAIWGKDPISKDFGLNENEEYILKLWKHKNNSEYLLSNPVFVEGNNKYVVNGLAMISSFRNITSALPENFDLLQNYPNPFNPTTTIKFALPVDSKVTISIFNVLGQKVIDLIGGDYKAGYHSVEFNASDLSSGIYFYTIKAGDFHKTLKMNVIK